MTEGKRNIIQGLLQEYDIETADDIQDALKDLLSGTIQEMLEAEMDDHLGYDKYGRSSEPNYRNGTKSKGVRSKYGSLPLMYLKIGRVPLNHRLYLKEKRTFQRLMTKLSPCMQKE